VNIVRWQIHPQPVDHVSAWRKEVIAGIGRMITCANAVPEVAFVADLHKVMPDTDWSKFERSEILNRVTWAWSQIADHVKQMDVRNVRFFGILNEPPTGEKLCREVMHAGVQGVQCIYGAKLPKDKKFVFTFPRSDPPHFRNGAAVVEPVRTKAGSSWHEVHMYLPFLLTHQGIYPQYPTGAKYPGEINGVEVNKEWLKKQLRPVRTFQLKYRRKIFVGEFSCSVYADEGSRVRYLQDLISIFEEWRWHWCYHAFVESPVWAPSDLVLTVLRANWSKNV
jgi:hypothetical protein